MRFSSVFSLSLLGLALAAPTPTEEEKRAVAHIAKRATVTDAANVGYATLNGGTTGGKGGPTTTVSTYAQFSAAAAADDSARVIVVSGTIQQTADQIRVGANKSIIGKNSSAKLIGFGLLIKKKNVIVRNLSISKVLADNGDAIGIQSGAATNIWVDHVDLSSDLSHDKDFYDGLLDITHAADFVTVSNTKFHDHFKTSLVGHSDNNAAEDTGHLRVTYANNYWTNVNSRGPSLRFGTGHIFNNYYNAMSDCINTRSNAQVLVESNAFVGAGKALYTVDTGKAVQRDNAFNGAEADAPAGSLTSVPYSYSLLGSGKVAASVQASAGATLSF
ncbi:MAG: hypothetical protein Q9160_007102 [Pyrenula sp. 1 TL-2023]